MTQDIAPSTPAARPHRRRRVILLAAIALTLVVAITLVAVSCTTDQETGPPTVRVDRGQVALAVSASGSIAPSGRQNLGFADGGRVSEVMVKVGDRVEAGQTLARVDDLVARQTLAQRQATLDQQLATLNKLVTGNAVEAAQATLDQARDTERATRAQVDATNASNRSATTQARTQLRFDQTALQRAEDQLRADRSACRASPRTTTPTTVAAAALGAGTGAGTVAPPVAGAGTGAGTVAPPVAGAGTVAPTVAPTVTPTATPTPTGGASGGPTTSRPPKTSRRTTPSTVTSPAPVTVERTERTETRTTRTVTTRVVRLAASSPLDTDVDTDIDNADGRTGAACSRLLSDRSAVEQAEGTVVGSRAALEAAEQRERTDQAAGQVSLQNARASIVSAQNQLATAGNDRPDDIAAQRAQVDDARAAVAIARQDVDETVITAPVPGTITAINGADGEVVAPPSAVTALAPGGTAPLPTDAGGTTTGGGGTPGAGAFVVLDAADPFQLVVPFEETDAARIAAGQLVDISVDALPNDTLAGRVTSIAPSGQDLSGIVSYYATVVVEGGADRLRDGQTAEAAVRVESVDDVLRVPSSAVRRENGRPTVTVTGPDGQPVSMPFLAGLVGDEYVEVRSGLSAGDQVELPQATVTPGPENQGPPDN